MRDHRRAAPAGRPAGDVRREEKCLCGHGRADHVPWLEVSGGRLAWRCGGGTCQCGACLCERFRSAVAACWEDG